MSRIQEALCLAIILLGIAVLAVFEIIPEQVAQFAPLAMVPRPPGCCTWSVPSTRASVAFRFRVRTQPRTVTSPPAGSLPASACSTLTTVMA